MIPRDDNNEPLPNPDLGFMVAKTVTFDGGTTNGIGDFDGTGNPVSLFTVTGEVVMRIFGVVTTNLAGASATVEVGFAGDTAGLIAQSTATDLDASELWHDATPDSATELLTVAPQELVINGADVILTVGTANVTAGVIKFVCTWYPVSPGSTVVSA